MGEGDGLLGGEVLGDEVVGKLVVVVLVVGEGEVAQRLLRRAR